MCFHVNFMQLRMWRCRPTGVVKPALIVTEMRGGGLPDEDATAGRMLTAS
jgi:hypothetical protein